jgi:hypothetical protein
VNNDPEEKIVEALQGVDILLSVTAAIALEVQRPLFAAAAKVPSIKRVIPSDFGTLCPPGVMSLQDRVRPLGRVSPTGPRPLVFGIKGF